jgi:hypothetical protein
VCGSGNDRLAGVLGDHHDTPSAVDTLSTWTGSMRQPTGGEEVSRAS